jgi:hypothetical protein
MLFDYRWPTHGYATSRETAMAAFAKSWRRAVKKSPGRAGARGHPDPRVYVSRGA